MGVIALALHLKHRLPRFVAWLVLFVGLGAASTVSGWVGGLDGINLYGVGLFTIGAIFTAVFFWEEAVKRNGMHRTRTPLIAFAFGISLVLAGGSFFQAVERALDTAGSNVDKAVVNNLNGK
ncbi:hypothetical protein ACFY4C_20925 [Actinomadura viridis]|uniref:hypothetical protein n=1 Tax=Actinomadura viridis TaxID=58110 RepID=UPI0036B2BA75